MIPDVIPVDFETEKIETRPEYPPVPVGCAYMLPGERPHYLSWGHPVRNNCSLGDAKRALMQVWKHKLPKLFHNAKFDLDVAETHLGMPVLDWTQYHDTMFLIFLQNPDRTTLQLKPVAEEVLNMPPAERDAVRQWLIDNKVVRKGDRKWGAHMARAPGDIVGKYAVGDIVRTHKLFKKYYREVIEQRSMSAAYDRERKLMRILLENERRGCRVDLPALSKDVERYTQGLEQIDGWIRKRLRTKDLNIDSGEELATAILRTNKANLTLWPRTPKGQQYSTSKDALAAGLTDKVLGAALAYRGPISTCLSTFMRPWLLVAQHTGGIIHTNWNQVAQDYHESGARKGTRTGRLSSNPNWQNIPTKLDEKEELQRALEIIRKVQALNALLEQYPIPMVRRYALPDKKCIWIKTDASQQELRILAHYEDGQLKLAYQQDEKLDMHKFVQTVVSEIMGRLIERKPIKTLNFGLIYGQGIGKTAAGMGVSIDDAKSIRGAHNMAFPGIVELINDLKGRAKRNLPIRTWGDREYFCEPPKIIEGVRKTFEYKLINTLIQGSAADHTKEAVINYHENPKREGTFLVQVHDEINVSSPRGCKKEEAARVREAFAAVTFDVPMYSESEWGYSYGDTTRRI